MTLNKTKLIMKKYLSLLILSVFIISCSKKEVIITGKINNASPLSRMEIIDISSVSTLPIANFGIDSKGNFADTISLEKDGVYALIYENKLNFIYLKKGEDINITGNYSDFPESIKITGKGQNNNEFIFESQKFTNDYLSQLDVKSILSKKEEDFIKEMKKHADEINKKMDEIAKTKKADSKLVEWKKDDLLVNLLMISAKYEHIHGNLTNQPNFKVSDNFKKGQKMLEKSSFIKDFPTYRKFILSKLQTDFQKFALPYIKDTEITQTEVFLKFLDTQKDLSQETKDYLASFIATEFDLHPQNDKIERVIKVLDEKIKTKNIKKDLEKVTNAIHGIKIGNNAPEVTFKKQDGHTIKTSDFKGKPTVLIFYSSFAPKMVESVTPNLVELSEFYKDKVNFVYINMDDDYQQFQKTSKSLMKKALGTNVYAQKGLKSEVAKEFHIYGFKLPSFVVLDKNGKIISKSFLSITDADFLNILNKNTGLMAPIEAQTLEPEEEEELEHTDQDNIKK